MQFVTGHKPLMLTQARIGLIWSRVLSFPSPALWAGCRAEPLGC